MKKQKYKIFTRLFCTVSRNTENTQRTATKQNKTIFSIEIHCTQNMSREITNVCSELFSVIFVPLKYIADRTMFSSTKHPIRSQECLRVLNELPMPNLWWRLDTTLFGHQRLTVPVIHRLALVTFETSLS